MLSMLRKLVMLVGLAAAGLSLSVPATAWKLHDLSHADSPVTLNEVHHHDQTGTVVAHSDHKPPINNDEPNSRGHDHILSLSIAVSDLPAVVELDQMTEANHLPAALTDVTLPINTADPPPPRPPSFA